MKIPADQYDLNTDTVVPIVGQRFRITGATILPVLQCGCEKGPPIQLIAQLVGPNQWQGAQGRCQGCGTSFHVTSVSTDRNGTVQIGVAIGVPPPPAES